MESTALEHHLQYCALITAGYSKEELVNFCLFDSQYSIEVFFFPNVISVVGNLYHCSEFCNFASIKIMFIYFERYYLF